jgi:glycosyltransferase involved in cell wall biosynthesis
MLGESVPEPAREWLSFAVDDGAVAAIAERVSDWLRASDELRSRTRAALVATARDRYSWEGVANGVIAAGEGRLEVLPTVRGSG